MIAVRDEVLGLVRGQAPHQTKDHTHGC
jgi:hypothetical protein